LSTPVAILIGSVVIGAGLYFGLRERASAPAPSARPAAPAPSVTSEPDGSIDPPPPSTTPRKAPVDTARAKQAVAAAIAKHRPMILERCWGPAAAKDKDPPRVRWTFNFSFDAEGKQIGRGVTEYREAFRPDVTRCLQAELPVIEIPAPGESVLLEVDLELP
jgi:hypothetical protein